MTPKNMPSAAPFLDASIVDASDPEHIEMTIRGVGPTISLYLDRNAVEELSKVLREAALIQAEHRE
jgi:hypothetical protein